jgi:hypothetical protein
VPHTVPQFPQCVGSFERSTHAPPQLACPVGHVQTPAVQVDPDGQAWPHEPQFARFVWVSTQIPLQFVCPAGHPLQAPLTHV